jgi:hypothetical protein
LGCPRYRGDVPIDVEGATDRKGVVPDKVLDGDGYILYLWTTPLKKEPLTKTK